jgi:hypothetical protein
VVVIVVSVVAIVILGVGLHIPATNTEQMVDVEEEEGECDLKL